jgi:hypothetical protein
MPCWFDANVAQTPDETGARAIRTPTGYADTSHSAAENATFSAAECDVA